MTTRTISISLDDVGLDILDRVPTPNIDALRSSGQEFTFWSNPACSPTRAAVMSGKYGFRTGIGRFLGPQDDVALDPGHVQLPDGSNALVGKWHLCQLSNTHHPINCGFDSFDGHMSNLAQGPDSNGYFDWTRWVENETTQTIAQETTYNTRAMTLAAIDAMTQNRTTIFLNYASIHVPFHVPPYGHDLDPPFDDFKMAKAMLMSLDQDIGDVVNAATQLGYRILLWADNGTSKGIGGKKGTLYERGIRNLCVAVGWAPLPRNPMLSTVDVLTLIDGVNRQDSMPIGSRRWLYSEKFKPNGTLPQPGDEWSWAIRDSRWKLMHLAPDEGSTEFTSLLFDLETDPDEENDLFEAHPQEAQRLIQVVEDLHMS
jgi:arylsulfatase A-like enzyme